ncbi:MAG TPA: PhzF family phenazine biosynthesis protein [Trebonia sp.]|jgi:trans-2,3-dihydro-3-hydroxyanthranilate isomerase|nr:PhzF family phenazine biosynthesis protein [Trebonia sp.]
MRVPEIKLWTAEPDDSAEITRDFLIADVFTGEPLEGNQLGIFPDGRGLSDGLMLKATREMNFSETVFFLPPATGPENEPGNQADAHVRIFTPGGEIPFAGHPTLGSAWVLADILGRDTVTIKTAAGLVPVELERQGEDVSFGRMSQPIPYWRPCDVTADLVEALGAAPRPDGLPVETYTNGPVNVYVEFPSEDAVVALDPDMQKLSRIPLNVSCFARSATGWITRMFAPALGVTEDPATGSAAGPLAVHLARHGRIAFGEEIEIRQGAQVNRPSVLYARVEGSGDVIDKVIVGGRAVVVARGAYRLG